MPSFWNFITPESNLKCVYSSAMLGSAKVAPAPQLEKRASVAEKVLLQESLRQTSSIAVKSVPRQSVQLGTVLETYRSVKGIWLILSSIAFAVLCFLPLLLTYQNPQLATDLRTKLVLHSM